MVELSEQALAMLQTMDRIKAIGRPAYDPLAWAVDETVAAVKERVEEGDWDLTDLRVYGEDMRKHGLELGRRINKRVKNYFLKVCEEDESCPRCFHEQKQGKVVMESRGDVGDERDYEPVVVTMECSNENCDYSEKL